MINPKNDKALRDAATRGPLEVVAASWEDRSFFIGRENDTEDDCLAKVEYWSDAQFFCQARTLLPEYIEAYERLHEAIREIHEICAGSEGIYVTDSVARYYHKLMHDMVDIAKEALEHETQLQQSKPDTTP